jgi:hypothetical protein
MNILQNIIKRFGFVTSAEIDELSTDYPKLPIVIRWGGSPREQLPASKIAARIAEVEGTDADYVRDCFIASSTLNMMLESPFISESIKECILNTRYN